MEPEFKYLNDPRLKRDPFRPPEGYDVADRVLRQVTPAFDRPELRRDPFRTPEGYFAWLPGRIMNRLRQAPGAEAFGLPLWRMSLSGAALVVVIAVGFLWFRNLPDVAPTKTAVAGVQPMAASRAEPARAVLDDRLPSLDEDMLVEALAEATTLADLDPTRDSIAQAEAGQLAGDDPYAPDAEAIQSYLLDQNMSLDLMLD